MVGHVEWVTFARVPELPGSGDIVHASEVWDLPAGGGAAAAVQLTKLTRNCLFITALGDDEIGRRAAAELEALGLTVAVAWRNGPTRRAFTHVDATGERTITVLGERIVPVRSDPLPWERLAELDGIYLTGGDADAVRAARAARVLVGTPRAMGALVASGVQLDVLVRSASDPGERYEPGMLDPAPRHVVSTRGALGGSWTGETAGEWQATALPGPPVDAYGCGDSFAAGLTFGLGAGMQLDQALELAARCGASCMTGRGPFAGQLTAADL